MKVCVLLLIGMVSACGNSALEEAKKMQASLEQAQKEFTPGTISTTTDGYFMKATINGEQWTATHMMPDENAESNLRRVFGENEEASLSFPLYIPGIASGNVIPFTEDRVADFSPANEGFYSGKKGKVEITAVNGDWVEGKFNMTATSSSSSNAYEITDGVFRIKIQ